MTERQRNYVRRLHDRPDLTEPGPDESTTPLNELTPEEQAQELEARRKRQERYIGRMLRQGLITRRP